MSAPVPQPELQHPRRGRPPTPGLREDILRAAEIIFTRHDYHEVQMDEVAEACGVGKGTLYRYFPGKHALYFAVMFEGIERLRAELAAAVGTSEPAARKIRGIVHRTLAHFWDRRFFFSLIHQNEHKPEGESREWFRHRQVLSRLVQEALENAMAAGHIRRIAIGLAEQPTLKAASASVKAARERVWESTAAYLPQVGASYSAARRHASNGSLTGSNFGGARASTFDFYSTGVALSQVLFDFG